MKKFAAITLFFFCIIVFSAAPPALAHDGVNAEVASEGDVEDMRNFLLHLKSHRARISTVDRQIEFRNALRTDNGVWRHGDTYVITVNREETGTSVQSGDTIFFHAKYPSAVSGSLRHIPVFKRLMTEVEQANGEAVCVPDDRAGREGNHICAVEDSDVTESGVESSFIQIAGFDHERGEADLSKAIGACPPFTAEDFRREGWLSADMVDDEESLVSYLKGVEAHISEEFAKVPAQQSGNDAQGRATLERMVQLMPCWRMWPWQSGSIYFYIVTYTDRQYGIFNGLTPQFQDTTLLLIDNNKLDVGKEVLKEVLKEDDTPNEGFLTYLWDNPDVSGDEIVCEETGFVPGTSPENEENEEVFCEEVGNPIPGRSPGFSVKRGYFILTDFGIDGGTEYVLGSGIYPKLEESGGGGGGCAIATGSGNGLEGVAFNLFLITAALFLATLRKSRPGAKFLTRDLRLRRKDKRWKD